MAADCCFDTDVGVTAAAAWVATYCCCGTAVGVAVDCCHVAAVEVADDCCCAMG
jgi:hypothetical protein